MRPEYIEMKKEEQKEVMLNILCEFSEFCERNDLDYFLDAGTLIGAVRHQGYIPWDDDIDVNMPREDYEKFINMTKEKGGVLSEYLYVEYPEETIFPFLKIADNRTVLVEYPDKNPMEVGVYIDVFPKDGICDASKKSKLVCDISYNLNLLRWFNVFSVYAWRNSNSVLKKMIAAMGRTFIKHPNIPLVLQQKWIRKYREKYPIDCCKYVTTLVNGEFNKRAPKECFSNYIMVEFEGKKFRAPVGYDEYLKCLYKSDYMQLPPEEERVSHNNIIYWKSEEKKSLFKELEK